MKVISEHNTLLLLRLLCFEDSLAWWSRVTISWWFNFPVLYGYYIATMLQLPQYPTRYCNEIGYFSKKEHGGKGEAPSTLCKLSIGAVRPRGLFLSLNHFRWIIFTLLSWFFSWFCHFSVLDRLVLSCRLCSIFRYSIFFDLKRANKLGERWRPRGDETRSLNVEVDEKDRAR